MTKRILCCINDRAHSIRALGLACEISSACKVPLLILLVNQIRHGQATRYSLDDVDAILGRATRAARRAGVEDVERLALEGADIAQTILDCAKDRDADHIIIGTGNPPFIGRLLMGSVSDEVIRKASCTITLVR